MVNVAGRSRGCANCRRRKVKCDETFPQCEKCTGRGLQCPGPRTGAFFVHVQSGEASSQETATPADTRTNSPAPGSIQTRNAFVHMPHMSDMRSCRATAFDQLFVSHFVESFGQLNGVRFPVSVNANWLAWLPQYITSPGNALTKTSIRSASMLSYGTWTRDKSIQTEAYKWYARALMGLQGALSQPTLTATESNVCSAVMLIHFETWAGTVQGAWIKHINGASTLLEAAGPQSCREGFMHRIFCHLRFQSFIATMYESKLPDFASPEWTSIPFDIHPANVFDQIVTILFDVQSSSAIANDLIHANGHNNRIQLESALRTSVRNTRQKIINWEQQLMPPPSAGDPGDNSADTSSASSSAPSPAQPPTRNDALPCFPFSSMPEAALLSLYHSAYIIVYRLLALTGDGEADDADRLLMHTQEILRAYRFVRKVTDKGPTSNLGPVMMVPQLKIASLWGSEEGDRVMATGFLKRISQRQSFALGSICDLPDGYFANVACHVLALDARR